MALKRAVLMVESIYEVTVDAQSVHHPRAHKLSVEGATALQLDPRWPDRTCPTPQRDAQRDARRISHSFRNDPIKFLLP